MLRLTLCAAALALAVLPLPALACSVNDDYRVPTNFELAQGAELILLASVTGGTGEEGGPEKWRIAIHPLKAIKGTLPNRDIELRGLTIAPARFLVLSNPYEFESAHPLSYIGGCVRYIFPLGTTALFFLKHNGDGWAPAGGAFSRWAEDVPGPDAPWARLAAIYALAGTLPEKQRQPVLEAERRGMLAKKDDPVAQLMAADIDRQTKGPNERWNVLMRREMERQGLGSEDDANGDASDDAPDRTNSVDASLKAMRQGSGEGN
jgi:hypothetical protein